MNEGCGKRIIVKADFFAYFRDVFGGKTRLIDLEAGTTIAGFLDLLGDSPARRAELFEGSAAAGPPVLKPGVVVMINGAEPAARGGFGAELRDGDTVAVFPLMGGG